MMQFFERWFHIHNEHTNSNEISRLRVALMATALFLFSLAMLMIVVTTSSEPEPVAEQLPKLIDTATSTESLPQAEPPPVSPNIRTQPTPTVDDELISTVDDKSIGLPVADLPISDEQRLLVERLGFDIDTLVLQQSVIDCARATLGEPRYQQISAGDTPSFAETARLLPCLRE